MNGIPLGPGDDSFFVFLNTSFISASVKSPSIEFDSASVSVGMTDGEILLDLDYVEDSGADTDMNFVFLENHGFIEIQGTGEKRAFTAADFSKMLARAEKGIENILSIQRKMLGESAE